MSDNFRFFLLHLSLIDGVGPGAIQRILEKNSAVPYDLLYRFSAADWNAHFGFSERLSMIIADGLKNSHVLEQELSLIEKNRISWALFTDVAYPFLLKQIHLPPTVLYWRGNLAVNKGLALIGSRKANHYGFQIIKKIVPPLVSRGWVIVSGGAIGADTMAHQQTLEQCGRTMAVLGSGLLKPYPASNKIMFERIIESEGALISPFPLHAVAMPGNFPARNRIIAGLSRGCVIVQAAQKSGARITAQYALDEGREVFAVPGSFDDPLSAGCHALIQKGAKLAMSADDILHEFGEMQNVSTDSSSEHLRVNKPSLDPLYATIIDACSKPCFFEDLLQKTGLVSTKLQSHLFQMQLDGLIEQEFSGLWVSVQ